MREKAMRYENSRTGGQFIVLTTYHHHNWHFHRVIESLNGLGWKGPQWSSSFNPHAMCRVASHQTRLPRATSSLALNVSRDGASTTSLGNLFQCFTTLWEKNFLLISNLNFPCLSLRPFPPLSYHYPLSQTVINIYMYMYKLLWLWVASY